MLVFTTQRRYQDHLETVHSEFKYFCRCGKEFACHKYLKTHLRRNRNSETHRYGGRQRFRLAEMMERCRSYMVEMHRRLEMEPDPSVSRLITYSEPAVLEEISDSDVDWDTSGDRPQLVYENEEELYAQC